jgi:D-alanine-D-alanine ligase
MPRDADYSRISSLARVDVIYSTLMGTCGENGNIMGLADILNVPIIGCGILASALALNKRLSKVLVENASIPVVDYLFVGKNADGNTVIEKINKSINFPCFVKPNNLGTCAYAFKAETASEFRRKWEETVSNNSYSDEYLIERFIPNIEVRVFLHQDSKGKLHANDKYVTTLREGAIGSGGVLFDHVRTKLPDSVRKQIVRYSLKIFKLFDMKDYARIDFFVETSTNAIYFNEANTQPHIGSRGIELMEQDGFTYADFIETMIHRNL